MNAVRTIVAIVVSLCAGGLAVFLIQQINFVMFPIPEGLDPFSEADKEQFIEYVESLPLMAFLVVLLSYAIGVSLATFAARFLAPQRIVWPTLIPAAFFFLAAVFNLMTLPHPTWFWFAVVLIYATFPLVGIYLAAPKNYKIEKHQSIRASRQKVFKTIAEIEEFTKAVPGIVDIEFLSEQKYGVGTRFRETRMMHGKEAKSTLEVTELLEGAQIRIFSFEGGTEWDTLFCVSEEDGPTHLSLVMDVRPQNIVAALLTPLLLAMVAKAIGQDMKSVRDYCEQNSDTHPVSAD